MKKLNQLHSKKPQGAKEWCSSSSKLCSNAKQAAVQMPMIQGRKVLQTHCQEKAAMLWSPKCYWQSLSVSGVLIKEVGSPCGKKYAARVLANALKKTRLVVHSHLIPSDSCFPYDARRSSRAPAQATLAQSGCRLLLQCVCKYLPWTIRESAVKRGGIF